jgi:hypothetical protein
LFPNAGTGTERIGVGTVHDSAGKYTMPRFYFHICDDEGMSRDEEGTDLPDTDAARRDAKASARDLISQYMKNRKSVTGQTLQIADETGEVLQVMDVRDVLN